MLNDLNNLTINGRKLEYEEKKSIVEEVQKASSVNMLKIIKKVINEDITTLEGARKDKNDKEISDDIRNRLSDCAKSITDIDYEMEDIHNEVFGHHKI